MKFCYFGFDILSPCLERLLADGHELVHLFTFSSEGQYEFNQRVLGLATAMNVAVSFGRPLQVDINALAENGCEAFISAAYAYKIPTIPDNRYGVNVHPTYLPKGRGSFPLPYVLLQEPEAAGITLHKLTDDMDAGDILLQKKLTITDEDDLETLSSKVVRDAPGLLSEFMSNPDHYWQNAVTQDPAQVVKWPFPPEDMRTINWDMSVNEINEIGRSFSRAGWLMPHEDKIYWVYRYKAWHEEHGYEPGSLVAILDREVAIAVKDGFICFKEYTEKL